MRDTELNRAALGMGLGVFSCVFLGNHERLDNWYEDDVILTSLLNNANKARIYEYKKIEFFYFFLVAPLVKKYYVVQYVQKNRKRRTTYI